MIKTVKCNWIIIVSLVLAVALLNYLTAIVVNTLKIPLFLDTWATSMGVIIGGLPVGIAGGVLYNLVMAFTLWGKSAWIWSLSNIWIAFVTWFLWKHGWLNIKRPKAILLGGLLLGFTNALLTFQISVLAFNSLPTYAPTQAINMFFFAATGNHEVAVFLEHIIIEFFDKTISLFLAAGVASLIAIRFRECKKVKKAKPGSP